LLGKRVPVGALQRHHRAFHVLLIEEAAYTAETKDARRQRREAQRQITGMLNRPAVAIE
jgi:hypothetical protein